MSTSLESATRTARTRRPIAILGTGKAARFLLRACRAADFDVAGIWGRSARKAAALSDEFHVPPRRSCAELFSFSHLTPSSSSLLSPLPSQLETVGPVSPLSTQRETPIGTVPNTPEEEKEEKKRERGASLHVFLAVADDAIPEVAKTLAAEAGEALEGCVVAHLSGSRDAVCLAPLTAKGAVCGALHPLMTLHDTCPVRGLHFFAQSSDDRFTRAWRPFVDALGGHWHPLSAEAKIPYHAAATMLCQGIGAVTEAARRAFAAAGFDDEIFREALGPLARHTLAARLASPNPSTLTGPAARGDEGTTATHKSALEQLEDGDALASLYEATSRFIRQITRKGTGIQAGAQ